MRCDGPGRAVAGRRPHRRRLPTSPPAATRPPRSCAARCASRPPRTARRLKSCLAHCFEEWIPRSFNTAGPGYLAFIPAGGLFPAALADLIADGTNRYTGVWRAAPALVQLEANVLDWFRDWMGFPPATRGLFTTGGSMSIFNAIVCARERQLGTEIRSGVLYTSTQAHGSVVKSARLAGILPDRVRIVSVDEQFRMRVDAPERRDRRRPPRRAAALHGRLDGGHDQHRRSRPAGDDRRSVCHDAACGITSTGPTAPSFIWSSRFAHCWQGSRADSLTLDPHKGLFLPYGTGALLVRDGSVLRAVHGVNAGYLPPAADLEFYDPAQHGPELSRGFPGLRVWLTIKIFGTAQHSRRDCREALAGHHGRRAARPRARDRNRRPAAALALRLPRRAARRIARRAGRRDPPVARAGQLPAAR